MQKYRFFTHVGCLFLCLLLLFPTVGCAQQEPPAYLDRDLTVEPIQVVYSADFANGTAERITALYCRILPLFDGPTLTDADRAALYDEVRAHILPMALRAKVGEQELLQLLEYAEDFEGLLAEDGADTPFPAYCDLYTKSAALLGHKRAGKLFYDGTAFYLEHQAELCEERYMTYGYSFYLEDAKRYRARLDALYTQLGADTFSDATRIFVFLLSFIGGAAPAEQSADPLSLIYDGEVLQILRMQADEFIAMPICAEQWETMGALYAGLSPKKVDTPTHAELYALQETGFGATLWRQMPTLLLLYRDLLYSMTEADVATLRRGASDTEKSAAVCRALLQNEAQLRTALQEFEALAKENDGAAERRAMERAGVLAACDSFLLETGAITADGLLTAIHARAGMQETDLHAACIAYLRGQMPYLAFALSKKEG